jgi:hypothetical protein
VIVLSIINLCEALHRDLELLKSLSGDRRRGSRATVSSFFSFLPELNTACSTLPFTVSVFSAHR